MKIGIFGGTFNPIHNAHLLIAEIAYEQLGVDKVWIMPNLLPPHKNNSLPSAELRLEMVSAAVADNSHFEASAFEIEKGGASYTVHTLAAIKERYPDDEIYLIIGTDSMRSFHKWYMPEEIVKMCKLAVYPRMGDDTAELFDEFRYETDVIFIEAPIFDISSTQIRERIRSGESVKYMLPEAVFEIIERERLYR